MPLRPTVMFALALASAACGESFSAGDDAGQSTGLGGGGGRDGGALGGSPNHADGGGGWSQGGDAPAGGGSAPAAACDDGWILPAEPVAELTPFDLGFRDTNAHMDIALQLEGAQGLPTAVLTHVAEQSPYHVWTFGVSGHLAGTLIATFVENAEPPYTGDPVSSCDLMVVPLRR